MKAKRYRKYYVETYKPPYPEHGWRFRVHSNGVTFDRDQLSASMVSLWAVSAALNRDDAIAQTIERAAGVVQIF